MRHKDVDTASVPASVHPHTSTILDPFRIRGGVNPRVSALWGRVPEDPGWGLGYGDTPKHANENDHSVVVRVDFGEASLLVTGDLEEAGIGSLHGHPRQPIIDLLRAHASGVREPIEVPIGTGRRTFTAPQRV